MKQFSTITVIAIAVFMWAGLASATVGGPKPITDIVYKAATQTVYYINHDGTGRGCPPILSYFSIVTGKKGEVLTCDEALEKYYRSENPDEWKQYQEYINSIIEGLTPLSVVSLEKNHIVVRVTVESEQRVEGELMYTMLRAAVMQDGKSVTSVGFRGCTANQPNQYVGYYIPDTNAIALKISGKGDCYEGGYQTDTLHFVQNIKYYDVSNKSAENDNTEKTGAGGAGGEVDIGIKNTVPGVEPDEIDVAGDGEPITPDFGILLGGGGGDDTKEQNTPAATEAGRAEVAKIILADLKERGVPVQSVLIRETAVETKITQRVKLFAIIPITTTATVAIDADEKVKVKFPWWTFFASGKDKDGIGERTFTAISSVLKTKHDTVKNSIGNIR